MIFMLAQNRRMLPPTRTAGPMVNLSRASIALLAALGAWFGAAGPAAAQDGELLWTDVRTATMTMRAFSDAFLDGYLARNADAALASVGCYQLEGEGVQLFDRIDGDYFTILGLPLPPLLEFLRTRGLVET